MRRCKIRSPKLLLIQIAFLAATELCFSKEFNVPRLSSPPLIDGVFTSKEWENALKFDTFYQIQPGDDLPPTEKTEAWIGYDADYFYACFVCQVKNTQKACYHQIPRDGNITETECVGLYLDTLLQQKNITTIFVAATGGIADGQNPNCSGSINLDPDYQFESRAKIYDWGYVVELAIPFKSLNFQIRKGVLRWGVMLFRVCPGLNNELDFSTKINRDNDCLFSQEDVLVFSEDIRGKELKIVAEGIGKFNHESDQASYQTQNWTGSVGATLLYRFRSNQTINITANPDFAQVEADDIHLTANQRYPVYYAEKRPFFLQNSGSLSLPIMLYYSRAIVDPAFGAIYSGSSGNHSIFALFAEERGVLPDRFNLQPGEAGNAMWAVGRYAYSYNKDSSAGALFTGRFYEDTFNGVVDFDGKHRFTPRDTLTWQGAISQTTEEGQASSAAAWQASFNHSGRHFTFSYANGGISPDFRADSGFIMRTNQIYNWGSAGVHRQTEKNDSILKNISFEATVGIIQDFHKFVTDRQANFNANMELPGRTNIQVSCRRAYEWYSKKGFYPAGVNLYISSALLGWVSGFLSWDFGKGIFYDMANPDFGNSKSFSAGLTVHPWRFLSCELSGIYDELVKFENHEYFYTFKSAESKIYFYFNAQTWLRFMWTFADTDYKIYGYRQWEHFVNVLFTWRPKAHTALYAGYNNGTGMIDQVAQNRERKKQHTVFVKCDWEFDLLSMKTGHKQNNSK